MSTKFITIGASLGGFDALKKIFSRLPADFSIPIAVVIHRQAYAQDYLCEFLQKNTKLTVSEAYDKTLISGSGITMAPAGYHLLVDGKHYALSIDSPISGARPSIDVMFGSAADFFGHEALGILLTGGGFDGVNGLCAIKAQGGKTIVEDPVTAFSPELPQAAITAGVAGKVFALDDIALELLKLTNNNSVSIG